MDLYNKQEIHIFSDENTDHSHENAELWDALEDINMTISKLHAWYSINLLFPKEGVKYF